MTIGMHEKNNEEIRTFPPSKRVEDGALRLIQDLHQAGHTALWAGGAVRDRLLGRPFSDIDIATSATPDEVLSLFPQAILTGQSFGVVRVPREEACYEVATFRTDGLYLDGRRPESVSFTQDPAIDARRRDFTVNALFFDPLKNQVLDFVEGQQDLKSGLIRAVGDPYQRFHEDRLRLLRAIRFSASLGFQIESGTWEAIQQEAPGIQEISPERISEEILRMLIQPHAGNAFRQLKAAGLLKWILPEVDRLEGVAQPEEFHPEGDVFEHTMLLLDHLEHPTEELAMAALFHDIGKPDTFELADRIRFNGHDKLGAEMFDRIATRLRLSLRQSERVHTLVARHMQIGQVRKMKPSTLKRMLRGEEFPELLELHRLDCLASHKGTDLYEYCQQQRQWITEEELKPAPLLNGHDLIALGLPPGPLFGKILHEIEDLQLEGEIHSRESALDHVKRNYLP